MVLGGKKCCEAGRGSRSALCCQSLSAEGRLLISELMTVVVYFGVLPHHRNNGKKVRSINLPGGRESKSFHRDFLVLGSGNCGTQTVPENGRDFEEEKGEQFY